MSKTYGLTCDTNVVQALYILTHVPEKIKYLEKHYSTANIIELRILAKNLHANTSYFVTPQIMKELEVCDQKFPGIVDFTRRYFNIRPTTSPQMAEDIAELMKLYFEKDIYLSDGTVGAKSALISEKKNDKEDTADAEIISENNATNGHPMFSLNEKHEIVMLDSCNPTKPNWSLAILLKNKKLLKKPILHKRTRANLKKLTATTFKVENINKKKYYLEALMNDSL